MPAAPPRRRRYLTSFKISESPTLLVEREDLLVEELRCLGTASLGIVSRSERSSRRTKLERFGFRRSGSSRRQSRSSVCLDVMPLDIPWRSRSTRDESLGFREATTHIERDGFPGNKTAKRTRGIGIAEEDPPVAYV